MSKLSINLPNKLRLDVKLVKSRNVQASQPIFPDLGKILRVRKGSKLSRFFRHIFEHAGIKKVLGYFIIISFIFLTAIAPRVDASAPAVNIEVKTNDEVILKTETTTQYPLEKIVITQSYRFYHRAVDLNGDTGDPIRPIAAGQVVDVSSSYWGYGNSIIIEHKNGVRSLYAHLSKINVREGDLVSKSTIIGEVGSTGRSFGDHLHLEIIKDGHAIDPIKYLSSK